MKALYSLPAVLLLLCFIGPVHGQGTRTDNQAAAASTSNAKSKREMLQEAQLSTLLSKVGIKLDESHAISSQPQAYRELKIRWDGSAAALSNLDNNATASAVDKEPAPGITVVEDKTRTGTLPRHRSLELSPTQIFIAAVDGKNQLRWWSIAPDPRIVRSETQTSGGEISRQDYYLSDLTPSLAFPDDPGIVSLRLYHPFWNGTGFELKLLAATPIH
jgi:hypothetical protein